MPDRETIEIQNKKETISGLKKEIVIQSRTLSDVFKQRDQAKNEFVLIKKQKEDIFVKIKETEQDIGSRLLSLEEREFLLKKKEEELDKDIAEWSKKKVGIEKAIESSSEDLNELTGFIIHAESKLSDFKAELRRLEALEAEKEAEISLKVVAGQKKIDELNMLRSQIQDEYGAVISRLKAEIDRLTKDREDYEKDAKLQREKDLELSARLKNWEKQLIKRDEDLKVYIKRVERIWNKYNPNIPMKL